MEMKWRELLPKMLKRIDALEKNGGGGSGGDGKDGEDGATFTPSISEEGTLSWTNDKGLDNPEPVNIKGDKGDTGASGVTAPSNGFFTMGIDENGDIYVLSPTGETTPNFEYDETTGELCIRHDDGSKTVLGNAKGDKGDPGTPGSDANVTSEDIVNALGYTPANPSNIPTKTSQLTNDSGYLTEITSENVTTALGYTPPMQDTVYTHPYYVARVVGPTANQVPAFGESFNMCQFITDDTGHVTKFNVRQVTIPNTVASTSANGLMSSSDKVKLDAVPDDVQAQLNKKIDMFGLEPNRALITQTSGKIVGSPVTSTELGYLGGVTSNVQAQLNEKANKSEVPTSSETWTFTLEDGSTVTKKVYIG